MPSPAWPSPKPEELPMPSPWARPADRLTDPPRTRRTTEDELIAGYSGLVPPEIRWLARPGADVAHAFSAGPGWMRSVCRAERWTSALTDEPDMQPCDECWSMTDGAAS